MVYGAVRFLFNQWDRFAMTKEAGMRKFTEKHPELFVLTPEERELIKIDPKLDAWGRFATGVTRALGAKTQATAHAGIDLASFVFHFGTFIAYAADHLWDSYRAGKPFREAKKKARDEAREAAKAGVKHGNRDIGERTGGDVPSAGPGSTPAIA
jgi:hypothetical protein